MSLIDLRWHTDRVRALTKPYISGNCIKSGAPSISRDLLCSTGNNSEDQHLPMIFSIELHDCLQAQLTQCIETDKRPIVLFASQLLMWRKQQLLCTYSSELFRRLGCPRLPQAIQPLAKRLPSAVRLAAVLSWTPSMSAWSLI